MGLFSRRKSASPRPFIQIGEVHEPTSATGDGVRICSECDTRWKSLLGELIDSGDLDRYAAEGDCSIYASWDEILGLTCTSCHRSSCMQHVGEPHATADVPQAGDYHCPYCNDPMELA